MSPKEVRLDSPPTDNISQVIFSPFNVNHLLVSSWDGIVRLYDVGENSILTKYKHDGAVLSCSFVTGNCVISGGLDFKLKYVELQSQQETILGSHDQPIRRVEYMDSIGMCLSGSWDKTIKMWDIRSANHCIGTYQQPDKVYAMSSAGNKLVVGTAKRHISIYDVRNMANPLDTRESSLKYQTRDIACFPNHDAYVIGSIEGRVAIEYISSDPAVLKKKYAFKCHRLKVKDNEMVFPVNAIAFQKQYNTFATGGADGISNIWDGFNKKRLCQLRRLSAAISSLSFSCDGNILATAISNINETIEEPVEEDKSIRIYIRYLTENETKPKA